MQQRWSKISPLSRYLRTTSSRTSKVVAWSSDVWADLKKGTLAPNEAEISAISLSSVETITSSNEPDPSAASMENLMMGTPRKSLMFFRGIRLLPPRAVMTARFFAMGMLPDMLVRSPCKFKTNQPAHRRGVALIGHVASPLGYGLSRY